MLFWRSIIALLCVAACTAPAPELREGGKEFHVYLLAGQSNMEGYAPIEELPDGLREVRSDFPIFMGNMPYDHNRSGGRGLWASLEPGFARDFGSNGKRNHLGGYFGPELTFAREMKRLNPEQNIAIIKYARSGSSLAVGASHGGNWQPDYLGQNGLNQYDFAVRTIATALADQDIDGDGLRDTLVPAGIAWMQGEGDALNEPSASAYYINLDNLIHRLRHALGSPDLPIVVGKITDSGMNDSRQMMPFIDLVHTAQQQFVATDSCAAFLTETDNYDHASDGWHYTGDGYIRMGRAFAQSLTSLTERCGTGP